MTGLAFLILVWGTCSVAAFLEPRVPSAEVPRVPVALVDAPRTCLHVLGYDECEHFQKAVCAAGEWATQLKAKNKLLFERPTVEVVGGTRKQWLANMKIVRRELSHRVWQLRSFRKSPLVMIGCERQGEMKFIGDWDQFLSYLRRQDVTVSEDCLAREGAKRHKHHVHGDSH